MNPITLQLNQAPAPLRPAVAWFVAGADVATWIEEICRWKVPQENLWLYVLPVSASVRSAAGVLVVPPPGTTPHCVPRALGFGVEAGKLYLPIDAQLWPPVEVPELKLVHALQVFHPTIGLVGFESTDALQLSDLLRQPPSRVENWNFARPGTALSSRLQAIEVPMPRTLQEFFGEAPNEIGTEPMEGLPPAPKEPGQSPLGKLWNEANRSFAESLRSFLQHVPHTSPSRTWLNDLEDWASAKMQKFSRRLEAVRNKEIHRLLHLLQSDPDKGLRFAIPMGSQSYRGLAPPAGQLGAHGTDFSLNRLGGGGRADFWHLEYDQQLQLQKLYRELANRELQLGRFRRAAYIFAELLGDWDSAAAALKQGKHFREAAVLYKDHLRRPLLAAQCLADGGLFAEAIALYEAESRFLEAGDLYAKLGQLEEAKAAYEQEIEKQLRSGDRLRAAQLLEEKLTAPERASQVLEEGWPDSPQAIQCLEARLLLLSRYSWHAEARASLERLRAETTRFQLLVPLVQLLSKQSSKYPDRSFRAAAADLARVKASTRLDSAPLAETVQLADALVKIAPEDKLLARDATRFCALRNEKLRKPALVTPVRKASSPTLLHTFALPQAMKWRTVRSCGPVFFAAGSFSDTLVLVRGSWEGTLQKLSWPLGFPRDGFEHTPLSVVVDEEISVPSRVLFFPGSPWSFIRLQEQAFHPIDQAAALIPAGRPDWLPNDLISACVRGEMTWLLRDSEGGLLECRGPQGQLISNTELRTLMPMAAEVGTPFHSLLAQRDRVWIAGNQQLVLLRPGKATRQWPTESEILSLGSSPPSLPLCALARHPKGVSLYWADRLEDEVAIEGGDLEEPLAAFTTGGSLVLVSGTQGRAYDVSPEGIRSITNFSWSGEKPIAVVRTDALDQFAVFSEDGTVQVFRLQG